MEMYGKRSGSGGFAAEEQIALVRTHEGFVDVTTSKRKTIDINMLIIVLTYSCSLRNQVKCCDAILGEGTCSRLYSLSFLQAHRAEEGSPIDDATSPAKPASRQTCSRRRALIER